MAQTAQSTQGLTQQLQLLNQQAISQTGFLGQMAASLDNVTAAMQRTRQTAQQGQQAAEGFGAAWKTALSVAAGFGIATTIQGIVHAFTNFATESIQLAARMQDLSRAFQSIEGTAGAAQRTLGNVFQVAQRAGIGFEEAARGLQRLEAGARGTTLSQEQLQRAFEGIVVGGRAMGISTQQSEHALVAWEQILTKGRLSAEELVRQLGNAIPGGLAILAQGLGTTSARLRDMAEANLPIANTALVAFGEAMRTIGERQGGIEGLSATFARLGNETTAWTNALGGWLGSTLTPLLKQVITASEEIRKLWGIGTPGATGAPGGPGAPGAGAQAPQAPQTLLGRVAEYLPSIYQHLPLPFIHMLPVPAPFGAPEAGVQGPPSPPPTAATSFPIAESPYTERIVQRAAAARIDPGLLSQLTRAESGFDPFAESKGNPPSIGPALGLGQLTLPTAQGLQPGITREQLFEPGKNLELAAKYLAQMLDTFKDTGDQVRLALTAYQSGPQTVKNLLARATQLNLPQTLAGISEIPQAEGGLGPAGRAYAGKVLEGTGGQQFSQEEMTKITEKAAQATSASIADTLEKFGRVRAQIEGMTKDTGNFNNVLGKDVNQEVDRLLKSLTDISRTARQFPELFKALPPEIMEAVDAATQQAVIWKEVTLTDERRVALLKQQLEAAQQLKIQQQTQLVRVSAGPEEAQRFTRQATTALQEQRLLERPALAALTLQQQIAKFTSDLQVVQNQNNALGAQIEAQRVEALRPGLEAELTRITTLMGRPDQSLPAQAAAQVETQFASARQKIITILQELSRHPALQDLAEKFQNALQGIGDAAAEQAQIAFDKTETQTLTRVTGIGDQIEQLRERIGAEGLDPLAKDLANIRREFAGYEAQLLKLQDALKKESVGATDATLLAIAKKQDIITNTIPQLAPKEAEAEEERRTRDARTYNEQLQRRLEQLQTPRGGGGFPVGPSRQEVALEQRSRTRTGGDIFAGDEGGRQRAQELQAAILAQERLNYAAGLFEQFGSSVGSAWTNSLLGIASGTVTVAQAFRQMAQSILQSIIQITSQEAWKSLISLGVRLILGAAVGGATGGFGGPGVGAGGGEAMGTDIGGILGGSAEFGGLFAGAGGGAGGGLFAGSGLQAGGVVTRPSMHLIGEAGPEAVIPLSHMQDVLPRAASGGGQGGGGGITVINVPSRQAAEQTAIEQRAMGRQTIINEVLSELSQGESSRINRAIRTLSR